MYIYLEFIIGMYLMENGIYYLKIKINGSYKRISLETTDIRTAKEIYNAYLLDKRYFVAKIKLFLIRSVKWFYDKDRNSTRIVPDEGIKKSKIVALFSVFLGGSIDNSNALKCTSTSRTETEQADLVFKKI
ncbi:MAG: hypothetical protein ACRCTJ_00045 [Brevinema sp.]